MLGVRIYEFPHEANFKSALFSLLIVEKGDQCNSKIIVNKAGKFKLIRNMR